MNSFNFSQDILELVKNKEKVIQPIFEKINRIAQINQGRVIEAMQEAQLTETDFFISTGYGYNDVARDKLEKIFAKIFKTESALVRPHISSGTHAIACALYGNLKPGDEILSITGTPYDTVKTFINSEKFKGTGTLADYKISLKSVELKDNHININKVLKKITPQTKMIYLQRSTGYSNRKAISLEEIGNVIKKIKEKRDDLIFFLDNCYGEFLLTKEPSEFGINLMAGSLIKNPGGGLAQTGGYVVGEKKLVYNAAARLQAPGVAMETGSTGTWAKQTLQGLFLAPVVTANAIKSAVLVSQVFKDLGYTVFPEPNDLRNDIIQAIELKTSEKLNLFCQAIQKACPIDSFITPEAWDMPGYSDPVIMACGSFVAGSSIELSADGPMREPYTVYFQGGLTYEHGKLGLLNVLKTFKENNLL